VVGWTEERAPLEPGGCEPARRTYVSPPSLGTRRAISQTANDVFLEAAVSNRRLALLCVDQGLWGNLPGFIDILGTAANEHVDECLSDVHGDANFGNQGEPRQAYEVLAFANDIIRFGVPLHMFHRRLYAWALLFSAPSFGSFEVAANDFGSPRRTWLEAVFLSRSVADELAVPFAQEAGLHEYLDRPIETAKAPEQEPE